MGFLELQRQCGVSHEVVRGAQGASRAAPGKSGLHERGEGERVIVLESCRPRTGEGKGGSKSGQPTEHAQLYRSGHSGVLKRKLRFSGFLEWPTGKRRLQEKQFWRGSMKEACNPTDCSLPGSSVHGISQARILEWVAISFSNKPSSLWHFVMAALLTD